MNEELERNGKYPNTKYLSYSPSKDRKDKILNPIYENNFIKRRIIITEKVDGENSCFKTNLKELYARSHSEPNKHETANYIKNIFMTKLYSNLLNENYWYYGENMFGIHSIKYTNMGSYFYIFSIYDYKRKIWLSWDKVKEESKRIAIPTVPILFDGIINNTKELKIFMEKIVKKHSILGGECEGGVVRVAEEINTEDFETKIAKYVREGHVQTSKHWKKDWKKAEITITGYGY